MTTPSPPRIILRGEQGANARPLRPSPLVEEAPVDNSAELRAEAIAHGYSEGRLEAQAESDRVLAQELDQRQVALTHALEALGEAIRVGASQWADQVASVQAEATTLAFSILEALLARELEVATNPGKDAIVRALALSNDIAHATARLHPADLALVTDDLDLGREISLVADESVGRGGAFVELGDVVLDARLGPAMERVRRVLGLSEASR